MGERGVRAGETAEERARLIAADERARTRRLLRAVAAVLLAGLVALYLTGSLDRALAPLGLNLRECATTAGGVTLCGEDLEQYRRNVVEPLRRIER